MPSDLTNAELAERLHRFADEIDRSQYEKWNLKRLGPVHGYSAEGAAMREAASRLSAPTEGAVEAVARALAERDALAERVKALEAMRHDACGGAWETYLKPLVDKVTALYGKCPTCGSPSPHLYSETGDEGEVNLCSDNYHNAALAALPAPAGGGEAMREAAARVAAAERQNREGSESAFERGACAASHNIEAAIRAIPAPEGGASPVMMLEKK